MEKLHPTQIGILNKLLFAENLRYTDLKLNPEVENNTFQFHLDKMLNSGYVEKTGKEYSLTQEGKKLATHIDTDTNTIIALRKVSVHLYCIRGVKGNEETLIYTRLKHPFYGKQGYPAGKVRNGEKFVDAAKRELKEETNLEGEPVLFNISHYLVQDSETRKLLDDKIFLDFFIQNPTGELQSNDEGKFKWIPANKLYEHILNPFDSVEIYTKALKQIKAYDGKISFQEIDHLTSDF